jgi:malate synthase
MIEIKSTEQYQDIFTRDALVFLEALHMMFGHFRTECLRSRQEVASHMRETGVLPDFPIITAGDRHEDWTVAPIPPDLCDRRVEITGPTDRKMVINALNSGAKVFMADFEDSLSPTWKNIMDGQVNLFDATRRQITYEHPTKGTY